MGSVEILDKRSSPVDEGIFADVIGELRGIGTKTKMAESLRSGGDQKVAKWTRQNGRGDRFKGLRVHDDRGLFFFTI